MANVKQFLNKDGKVIAILDGNTLYKQVHNERHLYKVMSKDCFGLDLGVFNEIMHTTKNIQFRNTDGSILQVQPIQMYAEGYVEEVSGVKHIFLPIESMECIKYKDESLT